jgi:uncharacterized phiE125 gp8 family phage protein
MALNANALLAMPEAKSYLKITSEETDSVIERMINSLSTEFETATGRKVKQQTLTDYRIDGNGECSILLPFVPVQAVTKVDIRYRDETVYKTITDTAKFVIKDKRLGLFGLLEDIFLCGERNILITMSVGFQAADVDWPTYQKHFLDQLTWDYQEWDKNITGVTSRSLQDGSVQYLPRSRFIPKVQEFLEYSRDKRFLL